MAIQIDTINDGITVLLIGLELVIVLGVIITVIYFLVEYCRSYKENKAITKMYEIYNKYKL